MTVALSSLRVTSDFDASGYTRGASQKVAADQAMIAADKARNASLAQADAALARAIPGMGALSRSLLDGYGAGAQFEAIVRRIGNAVDRGMGIDRATMLLDAAYKKFGLTADAARLAEQGFVAIVPAVGELNSALATYEAQANRAMLVTRAFADAKAQISTQAANQNAFNDVLGVDPNRGAGNARASADALLAEFGGLEGIARAKAREAGDAFSTDLNARLVAGTAKSARDASNVFEIELKRIETIAQQRAEQAGSNFQRSLTEALGGGGPSATSQGATYSALAAEVERLDQIEQVRTTHNAEQFQRNINLAAGIDRQSKSAKESAASFLAAAEAEEQMASKAALLRAQINPLDAEMVKLGKDLAEYKALLNAGHISAQEFASAQAMAGKRLSDVDMNLRKAATGGRVMAGEMVNLGYQVNDVITGLMLGQPVLMIAAQQGGQIYQIFQTSKASVGDFAKEAGSKLAGLVTPATATFTAIAAAIGVTLVSLSVYQSRMNEVQRQLTGMGRASGATALGIDAIAQQNASLGGFSINEARQMAAGLAATGKVGVESIGPIVALGHDFAKTFGVDAKEATDILAKAFADPARGAEELNQRLGFLDANTKILIESLVVQGNRTEAVRILTDRIRGSIAGAAEITGFWSRMATGAGNALSDFFDRVGRGADRVFNGGADLPEKIRNLTVQLLELQKAELEANRSPALAFLGGFDAEENKRLIAEITAKIEELRKKRADLELPDQDTRTKQRGLEIDAIARATLPAADNTRKLRDETAALNEAFSNPAVGKWVSLVGGDLVRALQRKDAAYKASEGFDPVTNQIKDTEAQIQALDQRSIAARARFAREAEARRQANDPNAGTKAERDQKQDQAARLAAGGQTALDNVRSQSISVLGDLATVEQKVTEKRLALINLDREGISVTDKQRDAILNVVRAQEEWTRVNGAVSIGIFDMNRATRAASAEFQTWIDKGYLDPSKPEQYAAAVNAMQRKLMDAADAAKVAGSQFPQLQNLANEAGRVDKQFDAFAVTSLSSVSPALQDMLLGTTSLSQGFANLGTTIVKALTDAVVKITIIKPLIDSLTASLGGGTFASGLGALGITYGAPGTAGSNMMGPIAPSARGNAFNGSNVIPFARGSAFTNRIFNSPTFFQFRNGGAMANGVMGEAGEEAVMPLRRGPGGRLGVEVSGGGRSAPIVNVSVKNYGNDNVSVKQQPNQAGGIDLEFMVGQAATKQMAKPGSSLRQVTDQRGMLASR